MSPRLKQRVALLLLAITALLPLQGLLAAWPGQPTADHCQHGQSGAMAADHMAMQDHKAPCCAKHQAGDDQPAGHPCNGGCDHCDSCGATAALFTTPAGDLPVLRDTQVAHLPVTQTAFRHTPLFRPPRALF